MNACLRWLLLASAATACAEAPPIEPWQVRAELQIVHLDAQRAVPLIARFTDDAPGAGEELRQLLADGNATLVAHLIGRTSNGERATAEQTQQIHYQTEMSPLHPEVIPRRKPGEPLESVHCPITAFERRDAGHTLEFEPFVHPGGRLASVSVNLRAVDFLGMQRFECGVQNDGMRLHWEQPVFHTRLNAADVIIRPEIPFLLGCCKLQAERHACELHVLTLHTRRLDGPFPSRSGKLQPPANEPQGSVHKLPWKQTRVELHRFIVPEADALRLRPALLDSSQIESAFSSLLATVKSGRHELAGILSAPLRDGTSRAFENFREQKYSGEFPVSAMGGVLMSRTTWPLFECPPTCVETRQVGESLSVEVNDDGLAGRTDLSLDFQTVTNHGFMRWPTGPNELAETAQTYGYRPDFTTQCTTTTGTPLDRQRMLFRFHKLPAPDGRVEITLIRAVTEHFTNEPTP